jgi:putative nucleotidyltransferase with HDIG domain
MEILNGPYKAMYDAARPFLQVRNNEQHTLHVLQFALKLMESIGGDKRIIIPAVLFHDTGYSIFDGINFNSEAENTIKKMMRDPKCHRELAKIHEEEGARIAEIILRSLKYPDTFIEHIVEIILRHDSGGRRARSIEEKVVRDADKLWRYTSDAVIFYSKFLGISPSQYLSYLETSLDRMFFTEEARNIALRELNRRRFEFG